MNAAGVKKTLGIEIPDTAVVDGAIAEARRLCAPYLFNHVMRSWIFATRVGQILGIAHDGEVLAVSTLLHDVTLNEQFGGPRRFEVEAADLARKFAFDAGFDRRRSQLVWDGVALNSTASIGLYKEPEVSLCTTGICLDVIGFRHELITDREKAAILAAFPRLRMKAQMTDCFCGIARKHPETAYDNFVRDFGERFVPGFRGPSSVDLVAQAPFEE